MEFENYITEAKERWGETDAYSEYEQKASNYTAEDEQAKKGVHSSKAKRRHCYCKRKRSL